MSIWSPGVRCFAASRRKLIAFSAAAALATSAGAAQAQFFQTQFFGRPQADVQAQNAAPAPNSDTSALLRIDRLEEQVRNLNGQVEQLQYQVKRLEDQLRKFQMDVDSRLQDSSVGKGAAPAGRPPATPQRRSELTDGAAAPAPEISQDLTVLPAPEAVAANPAAAAAPTPSDGRRHDAFDPSAQPSAPGAPLPLGSPESASKPVERPVARAAETAGPLDITPPALRGGAAVAATEAPATAPQPSTPAVGADPVKAEYEAAIEALRSQHYDAAQQAFAAFVQKNPHSRLIAPAIYHLGESYYYQNRHREAAEQFLKIATNYAKSPIAPDAMIKLGVSLNALGAKEQACAFFSELPHKYPNASQAEKLAAEREAKKASC